MRRKMTVLAAMLALVVASLTASPAMAQTAGDDQYGEGETGSIRGVVMEVSGDSVTVEGNSSNDACGAATLELSEGTEIYLLRGGTVPASPEDLSVGQTVEASYALPDGPHTMECPQTYQALEVVIFPEDGQVPPPGDPGNGDGQYPEPGNGEDQYGNLPSGPPSGGDVGVGSGDNDSGGAVSVLPDTGGAALLTLGAGVLLVAGGLLARRITR